MHEALDMPTEFDRKLGVRLAHSREIAKLTRKELASALPGVTEADVEAWELGLAVVYTDQLASLCEELNITPHDLMAWGLQ